MHEMKEDLKAIKASQIRTEIDIAMMKVDIAHHIKRSDSLEVIVDRQESRIEKLQWGLIGGLSSALIGIVFKIIFN